jgi:hypothetical protein
VDKRESLKARENSRIRPLGKPGSFIQELGEAGHRTNAKIIIAGNCEAIFVPRKSKKRKKNCQGAT